MRKLYIMHSRYLIMQNILFCTISTIFVVWLKFILVYNNISLFINNLQKFLLFVGQVRGLRIKTIY